MKLSSKRATTCPPNITEGTLIQMKILHSKLSWNIYQTLYKFKSKISLIKTRKNERLTAYTSFSPRGSGCCTYITDASNSRSLRDTAAVVRGTHGTTETNSGSIGHSDVVLNPNNSSVVEKVDDIKSRFNALSNRVNICTTDC